MLLSFERPAQLAGASHSPATRTPSRTALENCTVATQPRTDSSRGCISSWAHDIEPDCRVSPAGLLSEAGQKITVKIVRAHGGCLGT